MFSIETASQHSCRARYRLCLPNLALRQAALSKSFDLYNAKSVYKYVALTVSIILTGVAIGLLSVYGADVAAAGEDEMGFLPLDTAARGLGLGIPALILPIAAFFISMRDKSRLLGVMIIVAGVMTVAGGAFVIANADPSEIESAVSGTFPILAIGAFVLALGAVKLVKS